MFTVRVSPESTVTPWEVNRFLIASRRPVRCSWLPVT